MGLGVLSFFSVLIQTLSLYAAPCPTADQFQKTYEFLDKEEIEIQSQVKIQYAQKVSAGCEGSAKRFQEVYVLLKNSGVNLKSTLDIATDFSAKKDQQVKNFAEMFQKIFLKKYFDFDFKTAYHISRELSLGSEIGTQILRDDFLRLVDFCLSEKGMELPLKTCADVSLRMVQLNLNSELSIFGDWKECYEFLRNDPYLKLNQSEALKILEEILKGGPGSCPNFKKSFLFLAKKGGVEMEPLSALKIAKSIAVQTKPNEIK